MKIALDFDSVLSDTMVTWVDNFNKCYGKSYTKEHVRQWTFWNDFGISRDEAFVIFRETWSQWEILPTTENNLSEKTKMLKEMWHVDVVSNVESSHTDFVKKWLKKHEIHFNDFVNSCNDKEKLDYDYFIDDDPRLAQKLDNLEKPCLLYHQQWNAQINGDHITRISDLNQALEEIKKKSV